jgi:hypothetical protein
VKLLQTDRLENADGVIRFPFFFVVFNSGQRAGRGKKTKFYLKRKRKFQFIFIFFFSCRDDAEYAQTIPHSSKNKNPYFFLFSFYSQSVSQSELT